MAEPTINFIEITLPSPSGSARTAVEIRVRMKAAIMKSSTGTRTNPGLSPSICQPW